MSEHPATFDWTPERTDTLQRMWAGGKTGTDIGLALGVSRCAVLGKLHRLRLRCERANPQHPHPNRRRGKPKQPKVTARPKPAQTISASAHHQPHLLTLMQLKPQSCRWPIGDPREPDFRFCGNPKQRSSSYCQTHHKLSVTQGSPRGGFSLSPRWK